MDREIFKEIQQVDWPTNLKDVANELAQTFSKNASSDLEKACKLAYVLYLGGKLEAALSIVNGCSELEFNNDYNLWIWVDSLLVLGIRINRLIGQKDAIESLKKKVLSPLNIGNELQVKVKNRVHQRLLRGETLDFTKIEKAMSTGNCNAEIARRLPYLTTLITISELGGSDAYPVNKAEQELASNEQCLKSLLDKVELKTII